MLNSEKWIVAALNRSKIFEIHPSADGSPNISGIEGRFLEIIMTKLNQSYEIIIPKDGEFGRELTFGNWTGVIGMLHRGEADMAVANLGIYENRYRTVDFGFPYMTVGAAFGILKQSKEWKIFTFLRLFDFSIWMSILSSFLISTIIIYAILKDTETIFNVLFTLFGNMLRQPLDLHADMNKWKFVIGSWLVFAVIMSSIHSGTLLSFLALPSEPKTVETFEELSEAVARGTHRVYSMKGDIVIPFLMNSTDTTLQLMGKKMKQNNWLMSAEEMTKDPLKNEYSAVIAGNYLFQLLYGYGEKKSKVYISEHMAFTANVALAFRKGFSCISKLNEIVGRIMGSGIYNKLLQDESFKCWLLQSQNKTTIEETHSLSVKDLSDAFILLLIGLSMSLLVFLGEILFDHFSN
ncbi:lig_chan-Glu_bd domain-containing protein [Trichonephila inaurata madagascariensis]|uniref:Lig_chan-Glu_bd domain-containing protein n=1 Tax=Trichonephila inaurata madagascariensis TaxID=2747483 RepID=A0A8X6YJJ2_9ARAC|nr:lig_chan-Glu_bd domain-containing protein [Trichonephila inaurata madagascariensis]